MRFAALNPFPQSRPFTEVCEGAQCFDLHNDAILETIEFNLCATTVRIRWKLKTPAWQTPWKPEPEQRPTEAALTLVFDGVRSVRANGELLSTERSFGVDFMEYHKLRPGIGEFRLVLDNDAELVVIASTCTADKVSRMSSP